MTSKKKKLHFWLLIFLTSLLLTFVAWDHYFNSKQPFNQAFVSTLVLAMGTLFSVSAGFFTWSLESGEAFLENEVQRRTEELVQKEAERAAAHARAEEAGRRQREIESAYEKLEETQAQLVQSEKLASIGRVVAGVVHELNNPLSIIGGYAGLLLETGNFDSTMRKHLELIYRQSERCTKVVKDLLNIVRRRKLQIRPVDLKELMDEILNSLELDFKGKQIEAIKKYPPVAVSVEADPDLLRQSFSNLLVNASHALEEVSSPRRLTVTFVPTREYCQIFFTDNGCGISPDNISKIFEPFFTTKEAGKGTGLGLSLVYEIVREHGGRISVQSEVEKGTTFVLELPWKVSLEHTLAEANKIETETPMRKKVLVVDDEPLVVDFIARLLTSWGYECLPARNGKEALERALSYEGAVDLMILDIRLPDMDGFEIVRHFKNDARLARIPIIFLTGQDAAMKEGERLQVHGCLRKPFQYHELYQHLSLILDV